MVAKTNDLIERHCQGVLAYCINKSVEATVRAGIFAAITKFYSNTASMTKQQLVIIFLDDRERKEKN